MQPNTMIQNVLRESWTDYCMKWNYDDSWDSVRIGGVPVFSHNDGLMCDENGTVLAEYDMVDIGADDDYDMGAIVSTRYCIEVIQPDGQRCDPAPDIRSN